MTEATYNMHETCRQSFVTEMGAARSHIAVGQLKQAAYHLMRANGAVAQGIVYAELLGVTDVGWIDRMMEIDRVCTEIGVY